MSARFEIRLDDFLATPDFSMIRWDKALFSFLKKYPIRYIDLNVDQCNEGILEKLEPFFVSAEHLNITCTLYTSVDNALNHANSISKFHRFVAIINNQKDLNTAINAQDYKKNIDRIILNLSTELLDPNLPQLEQSKAYIHITSTHTHPLPDLKNLKNIAFHLHNNQNAALCNNLYQARWPYQNNSSDTKLAQYFLRHINQSQFKLLRYVKTSKTRVNKLKQKDFFKFLTHFFERVCRWFLFTPRRIKVLRKIEPQQHYQNHRYPLVQNNYNVALKILSEQSRLKKISSSQYKIQNCYFDKMNGSIEWRSIFFNFKRSTVLTNTNTPSLIKAQFSGTARLIGFYVHEQQYIVCQAEKETHEISLYIDKHGNYTLLRDNKIIAPLFSKQFHTPARISSQNTIGLAAKAVLGSLITQQIRYWDESNIMSKTQDIDYSVVVVCTRFSRRLEQLLKSICTQNYATEKLQILVCYVPGLDGTDDLIDSIQLAYPKVSIVRLPFHTSKQHHKGFMINSASQYIQGKKVLLTDADIVMPPDLFKILDEKYSQHGFVGAYARKMLSPETTAKILLAELNPQRDYKSIIESDSGELRIDEAKGRPVGFFQLVKTDYLHKVPYQDLPNFEGADAFFAEDISKRCEKPTIAKEITLLHLDHGGSQWYGTKRHM
ncbi:glycosyltransferase family 2 protein [bacterium]|nr:glycosyltransferase family 2 protein [bacterium]